jgi:hypothetical protein
MDAAVAMPATKVFTYVAGDVHQWRMGHGWLLD